MHVDVVYATKYFYAFFSCNLQIRLQQQELTITNAEMSTSGDGTLSTCMFCTIGAGKDTKTKLLFENDEFAAFADIKPVATHHALVITKRHIKTVKQLTVLDVEMLNRMKTIGIELLESKGMTPDQMLFGFHWPPFNTGL